MLAPFPGKRLIIWISYWVIHSAIYNCWQGLWVGIAGNKLHAFKGILSLWPSFY